jgi:hypothetical protein
VADDDDPLSAWALSSAAQPSAAVDEEDDPLSAWGKSVAPPEPPKGKKILSLTVHPANAKSEDGLSESVNRLVAEHQRDDWYDAFARLIGGGARGVGDVADTLAQGIGYVGERGARALQEAGIISPETASAVGGWRARINTDIARDNAAFETAKGSSLTADIGRVGGQIAGTAPFLAAGGGALAGALRGAPIGNAVAARPLVSAALRGAGSGAGATALTSSTSDQPLGEQIENGASIGALLGPVGYGLGRALGNLTGTAVDPEVARLASIARGKYEIPIRADQISANPLVRHGGSLLQNLPFTGLGEHAAEQQTAFNRAIANEFGTSADKITRPVIDAAKDRIGDVFDDVARRTGSIAIDRPFMNHVARIVGDARSVLGKDAGPIVDQVKRIADRIDYGTNSLDAESYQSLTRKGTPLDRALKSADPNVRYYAGQLREALDDAMERSAPADAVADLKQARYRWAIVRAVEPLAKKAATGDISPALVLGKSRGGNLEELGQIGQRFLKPPPSSGTAEKLAVMKLGAGLAGGALGLGGAAYFDPEHFQRDMAVLGSGLAAAKLGGSALKSNLLTGALLGNVGRAPSGRNVLRLTVGPRAGALVNRQATAPSP